jgi:hypothetical protein
MGSTILPASGLGSSGNPSRWGAFDLLSGGFCSPPGAWLESFEVIAWIVDTGRRSFWERKARPDAGKSERAAAMLDGAWCSSLAATDSAESDESESASRSAPNHVRDPVSKLLIARREAWDGVGTEGQLLC